MIPVLLLGAALLIALATLLLLVAARLRQRHGLPGGKVIYSDTGAEHSPSKPLYSSKYGLAGKPDYLVTNSDGMVPVEVKPGRDDAEPHESHLLQVLAYCLLLEECEGEQPPYGLLRYKNATFKVDYNAETRAHIIGVIEEMREARGQGEAHRNHDQPGRCRACAYAALCEEALL